MDAKFNSLSQAHPARNTAPLQLEGRHPSDKQADVASTSFDMVCVHSSPTDATMNQPSESLRCAFRLGNIQQRTEIQHPVGEWVKEMGTDLTDSTQTPKNSS